METKRKKVTSRRLSTCTPLFDGMVISGPIERAGDILPQIHRGTRFSLQNLKEGLCLILLGLFYKLVISDNIAAIII